MSSDSTPPSDNTANAIFKQPVPTFHTTTTLKRNTACHQCRRRKLKCDSQRPCSTCTRSHSYAIAHSPPGTDMPSHPECTYDEVDPEARPVKSKYERLEGRISELEGLLREMGVSLTSRNASNNAGSPSSGQSQESVRSSPEAEVLSDPTSGSENGRSSPRTNRHSPPRDDIYAINIFERPEMDNSTAGGLITLPRELQEATIQYLHANSGRTALLTPPPDDKGDLRVIPMGWPAGLPGPDVTRHLVQAFFAFHIYAGRLFHGPTFLSSLSLHPSDHRFPSPCVLHAMCAVGSMYTADIAPTPIHTNSIFPYEIFAGRWRKAQSRPDSFAEQQATLAKYAVEDMLDTGSQLIEVMQTILMLGWFYKCQGRWSESYLWTGMALRCAIPCGFSVRAPFTCRVPSFGLSLIRTTAILPPAKSTIADELRNNIFWIAYALERQQVAGNSYSSVLDDNDIYQLLPVRGDKFEQGLPVPMDERQWSHDTNVLLTHPKNGTDSFSLFVKAMMLISHVKRFNIRYKGRFYAGDADMYSPTSVLCSSLDDLDPRDTPAFLAIDGLVSGFFASFPQHLRVPIQDETVDSYLYTTCSAVHLAVILLHEPFADLTSPTCISANKLLSAARALMDLVYSIASTSYDVSLMDSLPYMAWFNAGRVLIRFMKVALDTNLFESVVQLQAEVAFVHTILAKAGERMPVAYRYNKILDDLLMELCGMPSIPVSGTPPCSIFSPGIVDLTEPMPMSTSTSTLGMSAASFGMLPVNVAVR